MSRPSRAPDRRSRAALLGAVVGVGLALAGVAGYRSLAPSSLDDIAAMAAAGPAALDPAPPAGGEVPTGPPGLDDGAVPDGTSAFEDIPAIARLDPDLLDALRRAAARAAEAGIDLEVNSGWRSPAYQARLLEAAVAEHGSAEEAARWVSSPATSLHVSGDAVDVGGAAAVAWLAEHGDELGLCQVYDNEPWHFELRPDAAGAGCPGRYADPTEDPRLHP